MNPARPLAAVLANRRASAWVTALALLTGVGAWFLGADVWHAILLASAITVVILAALTNSGIGDPRDLWWAPEEPVNDRGARDEIERLAQSLGEGLGTVGQTAEVRVRLLVRRRLAREGLDLSNADDHVEITRRLGDEAAKAVLREYIMGMRTKTLLGLLDALDALDADRKPPR